MGLGLAKRTNRSAACPAPLRRVEWVRVTVDGRSVRAEAIGVGYRLPATCRISMAMAADLARQGVPLSVVTIDGDRAVDDRAVDDRAVDDRAADHRAVDGEPVDASGAIEAGR